MFFSCIGRLFFSTIVLIKGEKVVQNRIEPPILLSRLLIFVLATAVVVLGGLVYTLVNMFPLNRPQIFFLTTTVQNEQEVRLTEMQPASEHFDIYKKAFVREYVRHRNEIFANSKIMHNKWNMENGIVHLMSTDDVYADFADKKIVVALMSAIPDFEFNCPVSFDGPVLYLATEDVYQVKIRYFCEDSTGPLPRKDYTIKIKLATEGDQNIKWADRMDNPLGLRVSEYAIAEGDGDPLDTGFLSE